MVIKTRMLKYSSRIASTGTRDPSTSVTKKRTSRISISSCQISSRYWDFITCMNSRINYVGKDAISTREKWLYVYFTLIQLIKTYCLDNHAQYSNVCSPIPHVGEYDWNICKCPFNWPKAAVASFK